MSSQIDKEMKLPSLVDNANKELLQLLQTAFSNTGSATIDEHEFIEFERIPDIEDFSYLSFLIIIWMRIYHDDIDIKYITSVHFKLLIKKKIGPKALDWFIKTFELLTLKTLSIIDNDTLNYWTINLYF